MPRRVKEWIGKTDDAMPPQSVRETRSWGETSIDYRRKAPGEPVDTEFFLSRSIPEPNSGCWIWAGAMSWNGYGAVRAGNRTTRAHRASYLAAHGFQDLPRSIDVCHRCDNRCCVNPDHLFIGSRASNMRDASEKGRVRPPALAGEACPAAKLTADQVRSIRNDKRSQRELGRVYGVDKGTIAGIRKGLTWRSVR